MRTMFGDLMSLLPYQEAFVTNLIRFGALKFAEPGKPFKLKSGRLSDYFITMAAAMDSGRKIAATSEAYAAAAAAEGAPFDFLHGPAMKGIQLVATNAKQLWEAHHIDRRWGFDMKEQKETRDVPIGLKLYREKAAVRTIDRVELPDFEFSGRELSRYARDAAEDLLDQFDGLREVDCFIGAAYSGIAPAASIVHELWKAHGIDKRYGYTRVSEKGHGLATETTFVGDIRDGDRALIIGSAVRPKDGIYGEIKPNDVVRGEDDVITTGKAKKEAREKVALAEPRAKFEQVKVGVHRMEVDEKGQSMEEHLKELGMSLGWIVTAPQIFDFAQGREIGGRVLVTDELYASFQRYFAQYGAKPASA